MKSFIYLFLFCFPLFAKAQQLPESSPFTNTNFAYNPALTGGNDYLEAHALYRREWIGFEEAPRTLSIGLQYPFVNNNMALGLHLSQDEIGVFQYTKMSINYAYHVPIASNHQLSFGIAIHLGQYRFKLDDVIATDEDDFFLLEGNSSAFQGNAGFGISYS